MLPDELFSNQDISTELYGTCWKVDVHQLGEHGVSHSRDGCRCNTKRRTVKT